MIKLEKTEVVGWEAAIRGMRNPMNSWDKSDSGYCETHGPEHCADCVYIEDCDCDYVDSFTKYIIGPNDHELMMKLRNAGTDHRKFMRMIVVYLDITAPLYWWKEFKTYRAGRRFGDDEPDIIDSGYLECDIETNSCSTMHKIHEKEFTLEDFSCEHLTEGSIKLLEDVINALNEARVWYLSWDYMSEKDRENFDPGITCKKDLWWQMIQLLPSSYNQKRTVMLNYEVLANIYKSRKNHKLDEWRYFCKWIEGLPYSELITGASLKDMPICNEIMEEAKRRVTNEED